MCFWTNLNSISKTEHELQQQCLKFVLELLFLVWETSRFPFSEAASLGASGHVHRVLFWCRGSLFSKPFSVHFFSEKWWQMDTKMASKVDTILSKMTLKNPPFIFNGNTQKTNRKSKKWCQNIIKIYEKLTLELNKKRCLKTYSKKAKNVQKMIPNSGSKSEGIFGVASRGAPLAAYFIFWGLLGPSWGLLGPSWSHLGAFWGHFWAILGPLASILGLLCCTIPGPAECAKRLNNS